MKKLDLYIIRKFLGTFFFILMIILVVLVVIDVSEKMQDFLDRKPPIGKLISVYYVDFMLFYGNLLSPICIFLAVIFFTSRLTNQTEIVAMLSGGISFYRVLRPYLLTATALAAISFYLNAYIVPVALKERIDFEYDHLKANVVMKDQYIHKKVGEDPLHGTESFIFLYSFNQVLNEGYLFSMELIRGKDILRKVTADKLRWQEDKQNWRAEQVKIHTFLPNGLERMVEKPFIDTTFTLTPEDIFIKEMRAESMPLNDLYKNIELEKMRGSGLAEELQKETYERFAYPFAAIILTMIGFSVSTKKRRGGTALQLGIGIVISFVYIGVVMISGQNLFGEAVPAWVGVWFPNVLFFGVALYMLRIAPK